MKHLLRANSLFFIFFLFSGCNSNYNNRKEKASVLDIQLEDQKFVKEDSTITAFADMGITQRRFIRTAQMNFKVKDVMESLEVIEYKTRELGGFVLNSHLSNDIYDSSRLPVSEDSVLQTLRYIRQGTLTLRVPDEKLDTLMAALRPISLFIYNREIHAEDVSIQLLTNQWLHRRSVNSNSNITKAIEHNGKKLTDILKAEGNADEKTETADQAILSNISIEDEVHYSTVSLIFYQDSKSQLNWYASEKQIPAFGSSFISQWKESLTGGWQIMQLLILFITRLWAFISIGLLSYVLYRKWKMSTALKVTPIEKS